MLKAKYSRYAVNPWVCAEFGCADFLEYLALTKISRFAEVYVVLQYNFNGLAVRLPE